MESKIKEMQNQDALTRQMLRDVCERESAANAELLSSVARAEALEARVRERTKRIAALTAQLDLDESAAVEAQLAARRRATEALARQLAESQSREEQLAGVLSRAGERIAKLQADISTSNLDEKHLLAAQTAARADQERARSAAVDALAAGKPGCLESRGGSGSRWRRGRHRAGTQAGGRRRGSALRDGPSRGDTPS